MTAQPQPGVSRHFVLAAGGTGGHLIPPLPWPPNCTRAATMSR
jgi:hypothetical protein